jgi:hypothetical protein
LIADVGEVIRYVGALAKIRVGLVGHDMLQWKVLPMTAVGGKESLVGKNNDIFECNRS